MQARATLALFLAASLTHACSAGDNGGRDSGQPGDHVSGDTSQQGDGGLDSTSNNGDAFDSTSSNGDGNNTNGDATSDGGPTSDAAWDGGRTCAATETCDNGFDDNCDGLVDENCPCAPGSTQSCYDGPPGAAGIGACVRGTQQCTGTGEFGAWSACSGAVLPLPETCDGADNDCDGATDEGLTQSCYSGPAGTAGVGPCHGGMQTCAAGSWGSCSGEAGPSGESCNNVDDDCNGAIDDGLTRGCYDGPAGTEGIGICHGGTQTCSAGSYGACSGEVVPTSEICMNGLDDNCNGMVDEGCTPCITGSASGSPWQMNRTMGPICFATTFSTHGEPGEYDYAVVPSESDSGWTPVASSTIDFSETSALCGRSCECLNGGEFTYFQTFFDITPGFTVSSLTVTASGVDDGARVSVYNSSYPGGIVDPGSYIYLGGSGISTDLARYIVTGRNRIVITHVDDCCTSRSIVGVNIVMNGAPIRSCP